MPIPGASRPHQVTPVAVPVHPRPSQPLPSAPRISISVMHGAHALHPIRARLPDDLSVARQTHSTKCSSLDSASVPRTSFPGPPSVGTVPPRSSYALSGHSQSILVLLSSLPDRHPLSQRPPSASPVLPSPLPISVNVKISLPVSPNAPQRVHLAGAHELPTQPRLPARGWISTLQRSR